MKISSDVNVGCLFQTKRKKKFYKDVFEAEKFVPYHLISHPTNCLSIDENEFAIHLGSVFHNRVYVKFLTSKGIAFAPAIDWSNDFTLVPRPQTR